MAILSGRFEVNESNKKISLINACSSYFNFPTPPAVSIHHITPHVWRFPFLAGLSYSHCLGLCVLHQSNFLRLKFQFHTRMSLQVKAEKSLKHRPLVF